MKEIIDEVKATLALDGQYLTAEEECLLIACKNGEINESEARSKIYSEIDQNEANQPAEESSNCEESKQDDIDEERVCRESAVWNELHDRFDDSIRLMYENNQRFIKDCSEFHTKKYKKIFDECSEKGWDLWDKVAYADRLSEAALEGFKIGRCEAIVEFIESLRYYGIPDEEVDESLQDVYGLTLDEAVQYGLISDTEK